jgi:Pretoxin HINT domain
MRNRTQRLALCNLIQVPPWIRWVSWLPISMLAMCLSPSSLLGDAKPATLSEQIAESVLQAETSGDNSARAAHLEAALQRNPKDPAIRWQAGYVQVGRKWMDVEAIDLPKRHRETWEVYVGMRSATPDNVTAQFALANWCRRHRLTLQERSHLQRVIEFQPDHAEARQRLGYVQRGSRWVEAMSMWKSEQEAYQMHQAARFWSAKILQIAKGLSSPYPAKIESAKDRLAAMDDPQVIYAVEMIMGYGPDELARTAIEKIAEFPQLEASMALARIAVTTASSSCRRLAAEKLGRRRMDDYVPALLNELSKPIESRFVAVEVNGQIQYRHAFAREHRDQKELDVRDLALQPQESILQVDRQSSAVRVAATRPAKRVDAQARIRAISNVTNTMIDREQEKEARNAQIMELNSRITTVLAMATAQGPNDSPEYWWEWWDQENDVYQTGPKPERTYYVSSSETYQTAPTIVPGPSDSPTARNECFIAGTPVLTWEGLVPIERIRRGDVVVSQDPDTGELSLQPVLATSVRPIDDVLRLSITDDEVNSSPGHPLWVSGKGWKLAKHLNQGDVVHGLRGGYRVLAVEPRDKQLTYNLVVDRFHTYFVGKSYLLVHDNTEVQATNAKLPGF